MADQEPESSEKEFEATPQKREQARREGDVVYSKEVSAFAVLLGGLLSILAFQFSIGLEFYKSISMLLIHSDSISFDIFNSDGAVVKSILWSMTLFMLPIFVVPVLVILIVNIAVRSMSFSLKKIKPDASKISPVKNIKNKYGTKGITDFAKDSIKLAIAISIGLIILFDFARMNYGMTPDSPNLIMSVSAEYILMFMIVFLIFQIILAIFDFPLQNFLLSKRMRMSREELKKDMKQSEGDPQLKQSRRDKASKISRSQTMQNVKSSTVVMVNPTHFAVALRWEPEGDKAPVCVAKGADILAARIREVAHANDVPIYSDPPTARSIYHSVEIDEEIRTHHFAAVAAAIQYVNHVKERKNDT